MSTWLARHANAGLILLMLLLIGLALVSALRPLQGVHWDVPIYIYQAKRFAETPLVESYMQHAKAIAGQTLGTHPLPEGEGYPESYWRFTRLGHIALLGGIVGVLGSSEAAIQAASLIYATILALAVFWGVLAVRALCRLYETEETSLLKLQWASIAAGCVYALSGGYIYMSGNLVAEVPALFVITTGIWLIALALRQDQPILAVASGLMAYLTYVVKLEAVWFFVAIYLALWLVPSPFRGRLETMRTLGWAALTALAGYGLHAALFHPLTAPSTFLAFSDRVSEALSHQFTEHVMRTPWIAVGLLWLGILPAMIAGFSRPLVQFTWLWFVLCLIPFLGLFIQSATVQTRMFSPLVPLLLLVFTIGFAHLMIRLSGRAKRHLVWGGLAAGVMVSFLIAHPLSYPELRQLPGAWRLQYVRQYLWPPAYEVKAYPVGDMHRLSRWLYSRDGKIRLVVMNTSKVSIPQENLNLVRFFGPSYPERANLALTPDPTNYLPCGVESSEEFEPVVFRAGDSQTCCQQEEGMPTFLLHEASDSDFHREVSLLSIGQYVLSTACLSSSS